MVPACLLPGWLGKNGKFGAITVFASWAPDAKAVPVPEKLEPNDVCDVIQNSWKSKQSAKDGEW